jgi:hypothetical protein
MANQEHIYLLEQSVEIWNQWRKEHREIRPDFSYADLHGKDLSKVFFNGALLSHTNLNGANLSQAVLASAHLTQANLDQADLRRTYLGSADLSNASLRGANLNEADLFQANMSGADMRGASLINANISQANLISTDLNEVDMKDARLGLTVFADVDLHSVQGLEHTIHQCKSYLSYDVITRSHGDLPAAFLQGVGFSDSIISALHSGSMITLSEGSTCFISYARHDQDFAKRLHEDLQLHGVRCWLDLEDQLPDALRFSIPYILVLSQHSVQADWVFQEVIDALAIEREQRSQMLIPVRLDETILQSSDDWAKEFRRTRNIGTFTCWKDDAAYQRAFNRLLENLKTKKP